MDSLFDDPLFVAALGALDEGLGYNPPRGEFGHRRTLVEWAADEGFVLDPPDDVFVPVQRTSALRFGQALAFAGLTFLGAAVAALLLHEELGRLIGSL